MWEGQAGRPDSSGTLTPGARKTAFITLSPDSGRTWLPPQSIAPGDWETGEPNVAGGLNSVYATWLDYRDASQNIFFKRWDGLMPGSDVRLDSGGICRRPTIAALEPHVYVAWECRSSEYAPANVFSTKSADSGEVWTEIQQATASSSLSIAPQIVIRQNDAWLVWQDVGESANLEIGVTRQTVQGWTAAGHFTDVDAELTQPSIAKTGHLPNEQLHLFWEYRPSLPTSPSESTSSAIFYSRRDTIPPTRPSQPIHHDTDADPGFDNDSRLTFSWESLEQLAIQNAIAFRYHVFVSKDGGDFTEIGSTNKSIFDFDNEDNIWYRAAIQACDSVGNRSELSEPSLAVFVDRNPPLVKIHLPKPDAVVTRSVPVIASCVDSNLVECRLRFGKTTSPQTWTQLRHPIRTQFERERLAD